MQPVNATVSFDKLKVKLEEKTPGLTPEGGSVFDYVFSFLNTQDLKNTALVSLFWREKSIQHFHLNDLQKLSSHTKDQSTIAMFRLGAFVIRNRNITDPEKIEEVKCSVLEVYLSRWTTSTP